MKPPHFNINSFKKSSYPITILLKKWQHSHFYTALYWRFWPRLLGKKINRKHLDQKEVEQPLFTHDTKEIIRPNQGVDQGCRIQHTNTIYLYKNKLHFHTLAMNNLKLTLKKKNLLQQ